MKGNRAGDSTSSRAEFATLVSKGLLTDMTVIVHGTALVYPALSFGLVGRSLLPGNTRHPSILAGW